MHDEQHADRLAVRRAVWEFGRKLVQLEIPPEIYAELTDPQIINIADAGGALGAAHSCNNFGGFVTKSREGENLYDVTVYID